MTWMQRAETAPGCGHVCSGSIIGRAGKRRASPPSAKVERFSAGCTTRRHEGGKGRTTIGQPDERPVSELLTKVVPLAIAAAIDPTGILVLWRCRPRPGAPADWGGRGLRRRAALVVFLVIMLAPMVLPTALVFAAPKTADKVLGPIRRTLQKHGDTIIAVACFVIAVYLAEKEIRGI